MRWYDRAYREKRARIIVERLEVVRLLFGLLVESASS